MHIMSLKETERIAICRILLDVMDDMGAKVQITDCRHFISLKDRSGIIDSDFETARLASVLSSLVILRSMHYNKKMLLALTVSELYSIYTDVPLSRRMAFETLMNAVEWPISFAEILTISRTE